MFRLIALLLFVAIGMKCDGAKAKSSKITHDLQIDTFAEKFNSALTFDMPKILRDRMGYGSISYFLAVALVPIGELLTNKSKTNSSRMTRLGQKLKDIIFIANKSRQKALSLNRNSAMNIYDHNVNNVIDSLLQDLARKVNCSACLAKKCSAVDFANVINIVKNTFIRNCYHGDLPQQTSITSKHAIVIHHETGKRTNCIPSAILQTQNSHRQDIVDMVRFYKDGFVKMQVLITLCKYLETGNATLELAAEMSSVFSAIVHAMIYEINYRLDLGWKEEVRNRVMKFMDNRSPSYALSSNYRQLTYNLWLQISSLGSFRSKYQILVTAKKSEEHHKSYQYVTCWKELDCLYIDDLSSINIVVARHFTTDTDRTAEFSKYMCIYKEELAFTLKELMKQNVGVGMPKALRTSLGWNSLSQTLYHTVVLYSSDGEECLIHANGLYTNDLSHWEISQTMNQSECRKVKLFFLL